MIYIITNNREYSERRLYFVEAPDFDMERYLTDVNEAYLKELYAPDDVPADHPYKKSGIGVLEVIGRTSHIEWFGGATWHASWGVKTLLQFQEQHDIAFDSRKTKEFDQITEILAEVDHSLEMVRLRKQRKDSLLQQAADQDKAREKEIARVFKTLTIEEREEAFDLPDGTRIIPGKKTTKR